MTIYSAPLLTMSVFLTWSLFWSGPAAILSLLVRRLLPTHHRWRHILPVVCFLAAPLIANAVLPALKELTGSSAERTTALLQPVFALAATIVFLALSRLAMGAGRKARTVAWGLTVAVFAACLSLWISLLPPATSMKVASKERGTNTTVRTPHVYLVVFDTMRRDVLDPYSEGDDRQPTLAGFARAGIVFEDAWTPAPFTSASHASMLFGVYPAHHQVGLEIPDLPADLPSLPLLLGEKGYVTAVISANPHLSRHFGYAGHFDYVGEPEKDLGLRPMKRQYIFFNKNLMWMALKVSVWAGLREELCRVFRIRQTKIDAASVVDMAVQFLGKNKERPVFLLLNFMETHWPYAPLQEKQSDRLRSAGPIWKELLVKYPKVIREQRRGTGTASGFTEEETEVLRELYLDRTEYLDAQLQRLFVALEDAGALDPAYIIFVSDHGELFGENGLYGHACDLSERLLHVPMILWWSEGLLPESLRGKRFWPRVSLVDIPHTIAGIVCGADSLAKDGAQPPVFAGRTFHKDLLDANFLIDESPTDHTQGLLPPEAAYPRAWTGDASNKPSRDTIPVFSSLGERVRVLYGNRSALFEEGRFVEGWPATEKGWVSDTLSPPDEIAREAKLYLEIIPAGQGERTSEETPDYLKEHLRALGYVQ